MARQPVQREAGQQHEPGADLLHHTASDRDI